MRNLFLLEILIMIVIAGCSATQSSINQDNSQNEPYQSEEEKEIMDQLFPRPEPALYEGDDWPEIEGDIYVYTDTPPTIKGGYRKFQKSVNLEIREHPGGKKCKSGRKYTLQMVIKEDGSVAGVKNYDVSNIECARAFQAVLKRQEFNPATIDDEPVQTLFGFRFSL